MSNQALIRKTEPLSSPWKTQDPFIFCACHFDMYPGGNDTLGPNRPLAGRTIGQDFAGKDGWNMYHGKTVPGFPAHPHSGFETVTIVSKGTVDHSDSLGAKGRFKSGDVQWLTSGKGVQHAEMFPLLNKESNPFEIFQLWLNLPEKSKNAVPHYKMLWREAIPLITEKDRNGKITTLKLIAGSYKESSALLAPPDSWASDPHNHVQIWLFKTEAHAEFRIPSSAKELNRTLYFYSGDSFSVEETEIKENHLVELNPAKSVQIVNGPKDGYFLFLQGRPVNEPFMQYGPFVANTKDALQETMHSYRQSQFGGWPWATPDPVHDKSKGRFSMLPDGKEELK